MAASSHELNLLVHRRPVPADVARKPNVRIFRADLACGETLTEPLLNVDAVVHLAGVLFEPRPEKFLPTTNVRYVQSLVDAALAAGTGKIILVSFPHVEGESSPERPARGKLGGNPASVHARTRLAAEKYLFASCKRTSTVPIALRPGMIYGRGVLMIEAARWLLRRRLLAVWPGPTWVHLLALPDFLTSSRSKNSWTSRRNIGDTRGLPAYPGGRFTSRRALSNYSPQPSGRARR
jgi:nucleoside-diphosphate-sugar epimerase